MAAVDNSQSSKTELDLKIGLGVVENDNLDRTDYYSDCFGRFDNKTDRNPQVVG